MLKVFFSNPLRNSFSKISGTAAQVERPADKFRSKFTDYKNLLLSNFIKNKEKPEFIKKLQTVKNEAELDELLTQETESRFIYHMSECILDKDLNLQKHVILHSTTLALEQYINKLCLKEDIRLANFLKNIVKKDTNPEIIAIKQRIFKNFNIKNLYFDNNLEFAQTCLDAMQILKNNNIKPPNIIIGSRYIPDGAGITLNTTEGKVIALNTILKPSWYGSTQSPMHKIIHECVHCTQPNLIAFNLQKIPKKFTETINELSPYASGNFAKEVHAELYTKKLLDKLSENEIKLASYFENKKLDDKSFSQT